MYKDQDLQYSTRYMDEFYRLKDAARQTKNAVEEYQFRGQVERAEQERKDGYVLLRHRKFIGRVDGEIKKINKLIRGLRDNTHLAPVQKRDRMIPLLKRKNSLAKRLVEIIREAEERREQTATA